MCQLIRKKLGCNKDLDIYVLSYHWEKIEALKVLKKKTVDFILIPFAYTEPDLEFYKKFYVKNPNLIIANLHHEELTCQIWDDLILPRDDMARNAVLHFVWTETFKQLLINAGVNSKLIYVTGNVRNDLAKISEIDKVRLSQEFGLDSGKKWLLYAEHRMPDKEAALLNFDNPEEKKYYEEDVKSLEETLRQMENLDNEFFENYELIYRLHPGSNKTNLNSECIHIIKEYAIYDWFNCIDALIVSQSTTAFEADMNGLPVLFHNPFDTPDEYLMPGISRYYKIHELKEISEDLLETARNYEENKFIYKDYMGDNDGKNADRIVSCIKELLKTGNRELGCLATEYSSFYYLKRFLRGKLFRLYKKSGLMNYLRKPAVFYYNQEDIPF